jgi:multicomponent K+:H+ antiporter subunit E
MTEAHAVQETRSFRQRWLPHPLLTAVLTGFWLLLLNDFSMGGLVLG